MSLIEQFPDLAKRPADGGGEAGLHEGFPVIRIELEEANCPTFREGGDKPVETNLLPVFELAPGMARQKQRTEVAA